MIGLAIMGIIIFALLGLMIASMLESPRSPKVAFMFTGVFLMLIVGMVAGFKVLAVILEFIVP